VNQHHGQVRGLLLHQCQLGTIHVATGKQDAQDAGQGRRFPFGLILTTTHQGRPNAKGVADFGVGIQAAPRHAEAVVLE
jgi:hypothetical protein